jgi:signal transduction histidine kinase
MTSVENIRSRDHCDGLAVAPVRRRLEELSTLLQIARSFASTLELEPLSALIVEQVEQVTGCTTCTLFGRLEEELVALAYRGALPADAVVGCRLAAAFEQTLCAGMSRPLVVADLRLEPTLLLRQLAQHVPHLIQDSRSWLAAPLLVAERQVGLLTLGHPAPGYFTRETANFVSQVVTHAAQALEHALHFRRARAAAAAEERQHLARELHDAVTQTLFAASLIADGLPETWEASPEIARAGLAELRSLTRGALAEMRTLLLELRPTALLKRPLGDLLQPLCDAFSNRTKIPLALAVCGCSRLAPQLQLAFYRITQEALNNIVKHAQASRVTVELDCTVDQVALRIADNGVGFEPTLLAADRLGLAIMRERAEALGAHFTLESRLQQGTRIEVLYRPNHRIQESDVHYA